MEFATKVKYTSSKNLYEIISKLNNLPEVFTADFETASKFTTEEKSEMLIFLETHKETLDREEIRQIRQFIESNGLSHPSLSCVTHLSVAWSSTDAFVAILPTDTHRKRILQWLANTERKQIWHNLSFDGKHIMYHTGKFPKNFEDTEVLAKTLLNHVDIYKAKSGLKHLMGYKYGEWGISKDAFKLEEMFDENLIKYAATDSAATYALWEELQNEIKE